jgi:ABC-type transporter Mla subunit MlaD
MAMTVNEAWDIINEIEELVADLEENHSDAFDRGEEFLTDVLEKSQALGETIENADEVTPRQATALQNWRNGVYKWHPDHKESY